MRRRVEDEALVNLEDKDYVRQGLWLQMESARLSLRRNDEAGWSESLARADAALEQYFDTDHPNVEVAREELAALGAIDLELPLPDISSPWAQLNLLRTGRAVEDSSPDTAAANPPASVPSEPSTSGPAAMVTTPDEAATEDEPEAAPVTEEAADDEGDA